ncbi:MAG TPA: ABC transporter substrate-binding protein [Acidimicrobiales bacterium]|nr:ABC transporter substrate-binding protein [Acidimicrobiales bacterium]
MKGLLQRSFAALMAAGALVGGLAVGFSPPAPAGAATPTTATFAELAGSTPNFIFPFYPAQLCSVNNTGQLQWLMYRPLYWPGSGSAGVNINSSLSLAGTPTFTNGGTTVTINLKNYKWSDGEQLTGKDVQFFMNMYHAEKANYCGYVSGFMPDNVTNVTNSGNTVTFTFNKAYNQHWILYNELAQITPLPVAWDISSAGAAAGSGGCSSAAYGASADAACAKVYTFLANAAGYNPNNPSAANNSLSTYATNPIWQVVDGPWKLSAFDPDGQATFVPNPSYSGPVKPTLKSFTELPYTTDSAEFNALVGGNLSVGYVPTGDLSKGASSYNKLGPNNPRLSGFNLAPWYLFSINYFPENFSSNANGGVTAKLFSQLYIRQAMQDLIDQPLYIQKLFKGYATPTYGPVPVVPPNNYASSLEKSNPYPYNPSKAKSLLSSHGWKIVPNGTDTCKRPGTASNECGAGIAAGTPLHFQEQYATGVEATTQEAVAEKASWSSVGINVTLSAATFDTVIGNAIACPNGCSWQIQNWAGGWTFAPDYYPSGEELFLLGSAANYGDFNDAKNATLVNQTIDSSTPLTTWENYLAKQLPDFFQPNQAYQLTEVNKNLKGATPQNAFCAINPENWRWK